MFNDLTALGFAMAAAGFVGFVIGIITGVVAGIVLVL